MSWSTTDTDIDTATATDHYESEVDTIDTADEAVRDVEESVSGATKKQRKSRRRPGAGSAGLTKAQVLHVLGARDAIAEASSDARSVLAAIYRVADDVEDLTVATVTLKLDIDPLHDLVSLRQASAENPLMAPAMVAGMDSRSRTRMNQVLCAITGGDEGDLPRDDLQAAVHLATAISNLTHADSELIDEVLELRG